MPVKVPEFIKRYSQKRSLPFQISVILFVLLLFGFIIYLIILNNYYHQHYYSKILSEKISLIRELISPALVPYIITQDYAQIEKYLHNIVKNSNINHIELINNDGEVFLILTLEKKKVKVFYKPQKKFEKLQEGYEEDDQYIRVTYPIKMDKDEENFLWVYLTYSKRSLKILEKESLFLLTIFVFLGILILFLSLKIYFSLVHKDFEDLIGYLINIPKHKGAPFKKELLSSELNSLKKIAEEISRFLAEQEKLLQQEKYKLEEILSSLTEAVVFTNNNLEILYFNPAFLKILEMDTHKDIIGLKLWELLPISDQERKGDFWTKFKIYINLKEENLVPHILNFEELYYLPPNGPSKILETSVINLHNEILEGFLFIFRDITQRKIVERELQRIQKLEILDKLAGGIAHDLRNLLGGLYNLFGIFKLKFPKESEVVSSLFERIDHLLQRASHLSFQLLSLSKGGVPLKKVGNLTEVIKEIAEFCFSGFPVHFELKIKAPVENLLFDPYQIAQVFQNLFLNAREAMPEGGSVTVEIDLVELKEDEIPPLSAGKYVSVKVSDTGTGIPPEILPYIFDPFFTTKEKGTGLGLSIVYQIMRHHNGHITVSSEVGKGSTFTLYLPYEVAEKPEEEPLAIKVAQDRKGLRFLVVDDEEEIREPLRLILSEWGYEAEAAGSGKEAIEKFTKALEEGKPYVIVLTDFVMPDIKGDKLIKTLKEINPNFIAILSTGYAEIPVVSEYKEFGFDKVLLKPYTLEDLLKVLEDIKR